MRLVALLLYLLAYAVYGRRARPGARGDRVADSEASLSFSQTSHPELQRRAGTYARAGALKGLLLASANAARLQNPKRRSVPRMDNPLQLFDLAPMLECSKLPTQGEIAACMETLEPWLKVEEGFKVAFSDGAKNGFIGGCFGALGAVAALLTRKQEVKDRLRCMYCDGTGQIACGRCLSTGTLRIKASDGKGFVTVPCHTCNNEEATITCINCQGSGRSVPDEVFKKLGDEEQGFTEDDYLGLFDNVPSGGPTHVVKPKHSTPLILEADFVEDADTRI